MNITHSFYLYGDVPDALIVVALDGKHPWKKVVCPTMKKAAEEIAGKKIPWKDLYVDGLCIYNKEKRAYENPVELFHEWHGKKKFHRIIVHGKNQYSTFKKGE